MLCNIFRFKKNNATKQGIKTLKNKLQIMANVMITTKQERTLTCVNQILNDDAGELFKTKT